MNSLHHRSFDLIQIEQALAVIPAHEREVWVAIGMALKDALGEAGFDSWKNWSQSADNYRERDARDVWKSFHGSGVSLGTLFFYARQHGWTPARKPTQNAPGRAQSSTKVYALEVWLGSDRKDDSVAAHSYAIAKGIESAGGAGRTKASGKIIGKEADCLVIPIRNIQTEKVQGIQVINPAGSKQTFGVVTDGGLLLGNTLDKRLIWFVCEGWASAYSMVLHHHDGNAVCGVAFGKGNLDKLALRIEQVHNPVDILILREVDG